ncbi:MAG: immunoglobulin domain-containing protein [Phycisphaerae bacterium]|nr:immunoglobulin domain-containing protein [Phycisphaerae bacterium]
MSGIMKAAVVVFSAGLCAGAQAQSCDGQWLPGNGAPGVNGVVNAMTLWDPDGAGPLPEMMVIGGQFTVVEKTLAVNVAAWDGSAWIALGDGVRGASSTSGVNALAVYNGKLYVGGEFEQAGAIATRNIASWNGSSWEALGPGMVGTGAVNALAVYQGELVAGGAFGITGGYSRLAKWNGSVWTILGASNVLDNTARALTVFGDKLIVGGDFATVVGSPAGGIASWDGATWQALGTGMSVGASVRSLCTFDGKLYAGGTFLTAGGQLSPYLSRWTGSDWEWPGSPFAQLGLPQSIDAIAVVGSRLFVGGSLIKPSEVYAFDGIAWEAVGVMTTPVRSLQGYGQDVFAGISGSSAQLGQGISVYRGSWQALGAGFDRELWAMTGYHGDLVVAGSMNAAPGIAVRTTAKWNGATWSAMGDQLLSLPKSLRVHENVLYLGGQFNTPVAPARGIVQWNGTSWVSLSQPLPTASSTSAIETLGEYQGKLLAAGALRISGLLYDAGLLWDGASWQSMGAVLSSGGKVTSTAIYHNELYIAGPSFMLSGTSQSGSVLRYDGSAWNKIGQFGVTGSLGGNMNLRVYQDKLYIAAASVRSAGGFNYGPVATWDGAVVAAASGLNSVPAISALTEYNGDLIIGGAFDNSFGVGANSVVRWNGTIYKALGQGIAGGSSTGRRVNCLEVYDGELIVGGDFDSAGGVASPYFARWTDNPKPWVAVSPVSQPANEGLTLTLSAAAASGYANVTYKWQRNGVDVANGSGGASAGGGTVSGASGTLTSPSDGSSVLLTINGIQASDAGAYTIVFSNGCKDATSAAAAVSVNTCPGDLNTDGVIDDADFTIFVGAYNVLVCEDPAMPVGCPADLNGDGLVEDLDFQVFIVGYDALVCE